MINNTSYTIDYNYECISKRSKEYERRMYRIEQGIKWKLDRHRTINFTYRISTWNTK